ncbi:MAG: 1-acyl-sn-glycerol-3-phosphate acyltransferase [Clostridia bacterium]|nr:1-acyl-sn-glycerol-3-phosphate acyltransferase [Clostridia bacterium]
MIYNFFRIFCWIVNYPIALLFTRHKTYYEDKASTNLKKGGKLLIQNHFGAWDFVLSSYLVFPRRLYVVTSEMPYKNKLLSIGMRFFNGIQANRNTMNMAFMDECAGYIKKGKLGLIYPEGRNTPDGKLQRFKHSYLVIAHRAQSPIVPIVSDGNYKAFRKVSVIVGREIDVSSFFSDPERPIPEKAELERANEYVHARVEELREQLEALKKIKKRNIK